MKANLRSFVLILATLPSFFEAAAQKIDASKREQFIQKALQYRQQEAYLPAVQQLDSILLYQANDAGVLLFKGDLLLQAGRYGQAVNSYRQLLPLAYETGTTKINLSYALFMNHQPAKALGMARQAWQQDTTQLPAVVNYFNALLWNSQTRKAGRFLQLQQHRLGAAQLLVLKARLHTSRGDYRNGLKFYDSLVKSYPDKYYAQEYAEVLIGKKEMDISSQVMNQHRALFSAGEYHQLQQKIKAARLQNAGTEFVYFTDVAHNKRIESSAWWQQREGKKYRMRLSAGTTRYTSAIGEKTRTQYGHLLVAERWNNTWSGETDLHLQLVQTQDGHSFTGLTGRQLMRYQPNDRRMAGLFYETEILNFTAALLGKNIRSHSAGYITHLMLNGKTGFYSQGSAAVLSDKNQRYQLFGSLYHLFRTGPTVKTGINFSALHFKNSSIKTYFSPNRYRSTEVFAEYSSTLPHLSKTFIQLQGAAGLQKIEQQPWDPSLRLQAEIGLRLKHLETSLKYQTSNVASANGTGYGFHWLTMRVMWKW